MNDKKAPPKPKHIMDEMANAAIIGGNAMASIETFGPVIGAVTGMMEEAVAMIGQKDSGEVKHNARAKKLRLIKNTLDNGSAP